jgi:myo-inositol-1(or 4)-monophosphatase
MKDVLSTMIAAADAGAAVLRDRFQRLAELTVHEKGPSDFVSAADLASEETIKSFFPGARFQAEETQEGRVTSGERFIIDPLDGTTNFLSGIPHFAISIAYWDDSGALAGVVLDVTKDELFFAARGEGASLRNSAREVRGIHGSPRKTLHESVVHTGVPHRGRGDHDVYLAQLSRVMKEVAGIRRLGAAALDFAYVAAGRGEAFFEKDLQPWDMAAGLLIAREAGVVVTDFSGEDKMMHNTQVCVARPEVHEALLRLL